MLGNHLLHGRRDFGAQIVDDDSVHLQRGPIDATSWLESIGHGHRV